MYCRQIAGFNVTDFSHFYFKEFQGMKLLKKKKRSIKSSRGVQISSKITNVIRYLREH